MTYKFYNRKGQRLSIFATTKEGAINNDEQLTTCGLSIYIIKHSKTPNPETNQVDRFNKKWIKEQFEKGQLLGSFETTEINPEIINLPCSTGNSKKVFMQYCNEHFYKLQVNQIFGSNIGFQFDTLYKMQFGPNRVSNMEVLILPSSMNMIKSPKILPQIITDEEILTPDFLKETGDSVQLNDFLNLN